MTPAVTRGIAIGLAVVCTAVVAYLVWGSLRSADSDAVGELPTVAEIVAAQAHQHGVSLPPLSDEDAVELSDPPAAVSTLAPFDQVRVQLEAVKAAAGLDEALAILADVASQSDAVRPDCARLYEALVGDSDSPRPLAQVCPA